MSSRARSGAGVGHTSLTQRQHAALAHSLRPRWDAAASRPIHLKGYDFVAEAKRGNLPTAPGHIEKLRPLDNAYWGENLDAVTERFEAWLLS